MSYRFRTYLITPIIADSLPASTLDICRSRVWSASTNSFGTNALNYGTNQFWNDVPCMSTTYVQETVTPKGKQGLQL